MTIDREQFFAGYLDAILFTESVSEDDDTSLLSHGCTREDFSRAALERLRPDCEDFIGAELADLERYCELLGAWHNPRADSFGRTDYSASERAGADFWLSRNGHGTGFFDRGEDAVFRRLQEAAGVYGTEYVYFDGAAIHPN